jgi:hypothetical protein
MYGITVKTTRIVGKSETKKLKEMDEALTIMESRFISATKKEITSYTEMSRWPGKPLIRESSTIVFHPEYLLI